MNVETSPQPSIEELQATEDLQAGVIRAIFTFSEKVGVGMKIPEPCTTSIREDLEERSPQARDLG